MVSSSFSRREYRWDELPFSLNLDQVAGVLQCSRSTAWRLWNRGVLPGVQVSARKIRVSRDGLRDWLASGPSGAEANTSEPEDLDATTTAGRYTADDGTALAVVDQGDVET